jgi:hypothetical protein
MRKYLIICILLAITINCEKDENPVSPKLSDYTFAIYFLQNEKLKMKDVYDKDLNQLKLAANPWLSDKDIRFYDWSSHCIYLKTDKTYFIPGWQKGERFNVFPAEWADKPFIVVANSKKCYMGYFFRIELSEDFRIAPMIADVGFNSRYPQDVLYIDWRWLYHDYPQNNPDVKKALIESGLHHGGISVTFDTTDVNTLCMIDNADTSTISYTFTITNNDEDDLYTIDPDKTGSDLFHWFTNGITFQNITTRKIYEPRWRKHASPNDWSPEWFTKIKSGQSIKRTVILKGYPYFPTGEYLFQFNYNGQISSMEKDVRELTDGRYWLGPTRANILVWNFNATDNSTPVRQGIVKKNNYFPDEFLHVSPSTQ